MAKGSKKLSKRVKPNKAAPQSPSRMRAKPILLAGGNPQIAKANGDAPVFGMRRRGRRTDTNPSGPPMEHFDGMRAEQINDRAQCFRNIASGPGTCVSHGQIDLWWQQGMMAGLKNTYDCVAAYSEGLREDVRRPWMTCSGNKKAPTSKKVGLSSFLFVSVRC